MSTPDKCVCPVAGWCERNRFHVTEREHHLCQTDPAYRQSFASGRAPQHVREAKLNGKPPPPPPEPEYPTLDMLPCVHRGESLGVKLCDMCGGDKGHPFEVFQCAIHGDCSLGKRFRKRKSCLGCRDRPEPTPAEAAGSDESPTAQPAADRSP